jgi:hypothetical protein
MVVLAGLQININSSFGSFNHRCSKIPDEQVSGKSLRENTASTSQLK